MRCILRAVPPLGGSMNSFCSTGSPRTCGSVHKPGRDAGRGRGPNVPRRGARATRALGLLRARQRGEPEERGRKGALSCDCQEPGPARNPAGDRGRSGCGRNRRRLMSREQAQELHGLSAKPSCRQSRRRQRRGGIAVRGRVQGRFDVASGARRQ